MTRPTVMAVAVGVVAGGSIEKSPKREISTERRIVTSALRSSDDLSLRLHGWLLFLDAQFPGDTCEAAINLEPEAGARYLIEYRYLGERGCAARCRRVLSDINVPTPDRTSHCDGVSYERLVDRAANEAVDVRLDELLSDKAFAWRVVPSGLEVTTSSTDDLAASRGGAENLIAHPAIMTHTSIPAARGIDDGLVRTSAGIETLQDREASSARF